MRWLEVFVAAALLSGAAFAESASDVLEAFGFTGTWARSCAVPPNPSVSWQTVFRDAYGQLRVQINRGSQLPSLTYAVEAARILDATRLEMTNRNDDPNWGADNGRVFHVVLQKENGRLRTLESKAGDGTELARDGVNLASGQPTAWLVKCRD